MARSSTWVPTFHAERLHDDRTWGLLRAALAGLERHHRYATVFVAPARARIAGFDLRARVRELRDRGHEVALHTHFYRLLDRGPGERIVKESAFDAATIDRCLTEDVASLHNCGVEPRGFVAGGFARCAPAFSWLADHGFTYDASYRAFASRATPSDPGPDATAPFRLGDLVEVCTTAPLRTALAHRARLGRAGTVDAAGLRYAVVYLHDYDLLRSRVAYAWHALCLTLRHAPVVHGAQLARTLDPRLENAIDGDHAQA